MPAPSRPDHVVQIRRALIDPRWLCEALGLLDGYKPGRQANGGLLIRCPVHADRTPSCSVRLGADGTIAVKCQGCGWSGDALTLVAAAHGLDVKREFLTVLQEAGALAGVEVTPGARRSPRPTETRSLRALQPAAGLADDAFDRLATSLLEAAPLDGPEARDVAAYLEGRGLLEEASRDGWGGLPQGAAQRLLVERLAKEHGAEALALSGLVRQDDRGRPQLDRLSWPHHRLVIPYRSPGVAGVIATLQRRRLDPGDPRYVGTPGRPAPWPYGAELADDAGPDTAIVYVEGAADVLASRALFQAERLDRIALGVPGLQNWRREWARFARGRVAIIALDADSAGEAAVQSVASELRAAGALGVKRSRPVRGKDWADMVKRA
jgi:DNA primase